MGNVEIIESFDITQLDLTDIARQGVYLGIGMVFLTVLTGWTIGKIIKLMMGKS